jgi:hypothetical protein
MPQPARRKPTLADAMILVAMTAVGLSCYLFIDNALFRGQRYLFGLFERPTGGWDAARLVNRAAGAVSLLLPPFGSWTLAVPLIRLRPPRSSRTRWHRQAGVTACVAAITGMALPAAVAGCAFLLRWWVEGTTRLPPNYWLRTPLFDDIVACAGASVAAVWITQAVTGLWRPSVDWVDRLGRALGGLWIVAGLIFGMRLVMG